MFRGIKRGKYAKRIKWIKKMYNEEDRCLMCEGSLGNMVGGFGSNLRMGIEDDCLRFRMEEWVKDDDGKDKMLLNEFARQPINFCPYCGRQLRKEVDWNLCD